MGKPLAFQRGKEFLRCLGRVAEALPLPLDGGADHAGSHFEKANQKVVWMLRLDVETGKRVRRKVGEIVGHDYVGTGAYGSCQDMAVVWIGQGKGLDQLFVTHHEAVTDGLVH